MDEWSYHSSGIDVGRGMSIDVTWGKIDFSLGGKKVKLHQTHDTNPVFLGLPPHLRPVFPGDLCDTGWDTADWHKWQSWEEEKVAGVRTDECQVEIYT